MTNFLHRRKTTWVLVLWSAYVATWAGLTGPGPAMAALWWFAGTVVFGLPWLGTRQIFQRGRGLLGGFLEAGWRGMARRRAPVDDTAAELWHDADSGRTAAPRAGIETRRTLASSVPGAAPGTST